MVTTDTGWSNHVEEVKRAVASKEVFFWGHPILRFDGMPRWRTVSWLSFCWALAAVAM